METNSTADTPAPRPPLAPDSSAEASLLQRLIGLSWMRNAFGMLVLVAMVGGLIAYDRLNSGTGDLGPLDGNSPSVGELAPQFALRDPDGTVHQLSDFRGQVVWVNFWATWCGPCKRELPDIQALANEFADDGLIVLEVNFDESATAATEFWAELELDLPILLDEGGAVVEQYRLRGFPDNFFIDRDGVLRDFSLGFLTEEQMRESLAEAGLEGTALLNGE